MKLFKLSFSIFCGAKWGGLDIEVIGVSKEQCLEVALNQCSAIHLERSCGYGKTVTLADYDALPGYNEPNSWINKDYELFKLNPEKYVDLHWEELELPLIKLT